MCQGRPGQSKILEDYKTSHHHHHNHHHHHHEQQVQRDGLVRGGAQAQATLEPHLFLMNCQERCYTRCIGALLCGVYQKYEGSIQ